MRSNRLIRRFMASTSGSFAVIVAITMVPVMLSVGLATDYSMGVRTRSSMQNALDAATESMTTLAKDTSEAARQKKLQDMYSANGGEGTASLNAYEFDADGTLHVDTSARYDMPTNFMKLARIDSVKVGVSSGILKKPTLIEATFKLNKVSGYWDKVMTLYGTEFEAKDKDAKPLMKIEYEYNGGGGDKGFGTTTVLTPDSRGRFKNVVQQQVCESKDSGSYSRRNPAPAGSFADGNKTVSCKYTVGDGDGAPIDVSQMKDLYLQMDVPDGNPDVLRSNDPKTSDRLFIDGTEVKAGQTVDIFTAVPCGQTSDQAWEDGGSKVPGLVKDADFMYTVTGKCNYTQRIAQTRFTK